MRITIRFLHTLTETWVLHLGANHETDTFWVIFENKCIKQVFNDRKQLNTFLVHVQFVIVLAAKCIKLKYQYLLLDANLYRFLHYIWMFTRLSKDNWA